MPGSSGGILVAPGSATPVVFRSGICRAWCAVAVVAGVLLCPTPARAADECEELTLCEITGPAALCRVPLAVTRDQEVVHVTVQERSPGLKVRWQVLRNGQPDPSCVVDPPDRLDVQTCGPLALGAYDIFVAPEPGSGTGTVAVQVQSLVGCASTPIDCEQTVEGQIDPGEDTDLLRFTVADQEIVRVTIRALVSLGSLVPEWRIVTLAGLPEASCGVFRRTGGRDCGPLAAGEYAIEVRDEISARTGSFALHLQRLTAAAACDSTALRCAQPLTAEISAALESDLFRFAVIDGESPVVAVGRRSGDLVPAWRLLAATGIPAPSCSLFTTAANGNCGPLPAGEYQVQVKDDLAQRTGAYDVAVFFSVAECCGDRARTGSEECDPPGGCCSESCRLVAAGTVCRAAGGSCDEAETCDGASALCPPEPGVCDDGCANSGEQCGEPELAACGALHTCSGCRCLACAEPRLRCGADDDLTIELGVGSSLPVGGYEARLAWDPAILRLDGVAGGSTTEFSGAPSCATDAAAGTATCSAAQNVRRDGPLGDVVLARSRFARAGTPAPRTVTVTSLRVTDPDGAPLAVCPGEASCTLAGCAAAADCADADPCTDDDCDAGSCTSRRRTGFALADCEVAKVGTVTCGVVPIDARTQRLLSTRVGKIRGLLARATTAVPPARTRVLLRAERQLASLARILGRRRSLPLRCRATFGEMIAANRQLVAALRP